MTEGPIYTRGQTYRARAEARQRAFRAARSIDHGKYGHLLSEAAAGDGKNFVLNESFVAARKRQRDGKGVALRTFENMLSSQAMCFNIFAPLASRLELATEVLQPFIAGLRAVTAIQFEYTPDMDVFRDQSGRGGVDCDLLVTGRTDVGKLVQVIETKFVEPEFSSCGFRKSGRAKKGQDVCPEEVRVREDRAACLYVRNKGYGYWERTDQHELLAADALDAMGCPFGDAKWQLWVNLALAHEEAARREASDVRFAVCVSPANTALLRDDVLGSFRSLLREPNAVTLLDLEGLLLRVQERAPESLASWASELGARYAAI